MIHSFSDRRPSQRLISKIGLRHELFKSRFTSEQERWQYDGHDSVSPREVESALSQYIS